jgi:hypothetical protein
MPKKYRVELSLIERQQDGTDSTLETEPLAESDVEQEARDAYEDKKNKAKGHGEGHG